MQYLFRALDTLFEPLVVLDFDDFCDLDFEGCLRGRVPVLE